MVVHCPRRVHFEIEGIKYNATFGYSSADPASKCSNPECSDVGVFAAAVVIQDIVWKSLGGEVPLEKTSPQWEMIVAALQLRLGHGQTHCGTASSPFCEEAMNRQNYIATVKAFNIKIKGRRRWDNLIVNKARKAVKKTKKAMKKAARLARKSAHRNRSCRMAHGG